MPMFSYMNPGLKTFGPIIQLYLAIPAAEETKLIAAGQADAELMPVAALIDTGADNTVIDPAVVETLQLQPSGEGPVGGATLGDSVAKHYPVRLVFPDNSEHEVVAYALPLASKGYLCMIGRDLLAHGGLIYNGRDNQYSLYF